MTDPFKPVAEIVGSSPFRFKADEQVAGSLHVYERFADYQPRSDGVADFVAGPKITYFDRVEVPYHFGSDKRYRGVANWRNGLGRIPNRGRFADPPS